MPTKIRLQRHGKKGKPFYHIVIADARAPRDGKFIEKIGTYNPNVNPAAIDMKDDRALHWVQVGAVPTDTVKAMLSYRGILYKNHLLKGVAKGALTEAEAEKRFETWKKEKDGKIQSKIDKLDSDATAAKKAALAAETEIKEAKEKELAAKNSPLAEEVENTEAETAASENVEVQETEAVADAAPVQEEEAPVAEKTPTEVPKAEEEPKEEKAPAEEAKEKDSSEENSAE